MINLLIVDDHPVMRELLRQVLETHRDVSIVAEAVSGEDAVRQAARLRPTVAIVDIHLPAMSGLEATKLIRQNESLKNVPIIAVTAHHEDDFRNDAKASGFDAYVTKPIDVNWLKELIAGLLI